MRFILIVLLFIGCNTTPQKAELKKENERLQIEVDSLKNELYKCDMLMQAYENDPLTI